MATNSPKGGDHPCRECNSTFETEEDLERHLRSEHEMGSKWNPDSQLRP